MNFSRFREPTRADLMAFCQGPCGRRLHYELLNDDGLCEECKSDEDERKTENETKT